MMTMRAWVPSADQNGVNFMINTKAMPVLQPSAVSPYHPNTTRQPDPGRLCRSPALIPQGGARSDAGFGAYRRSQPVAVASAPCVDITDEPLAAVVVDACPQKGVSRYVEIARLMI